MRNTFILYVILSSILLGSCVTRIDVPEQEQPVLLLKLEMLRNSPEITATLSSTNNLKGTFPIEFPEDSRIKVYRAGYNNEVVSDFTYDFDRELYVFKGGVEASNLLLTPNFDLEVTATVPDEKFPRISAKARVPLFSELVDLVLVEESTAIEDDKAFWTGTVRFNFRDLNTRTEQYYQLLLQERETVRTISVDTTYSFVSDLSNFQIVSISSGKEAVKEFQHQEGIFVDLDKLDSDFIELTLRSGIAIASDDQVTDHIFSSVISLTADHYMHHLGLSNIEAAKNDIFGEPALYRSNINGGLGLFSTCVKKDKVLSLR